MMTKTTHIQEPAFGHKLNYIHYHHPSKYFVIFYHGTGKKGPADGSQIHILEDEGMPENAKNGFPYQFNIIAPQSAYNHNTLLKYLPAFIKMKYGQDSIIIVTGLSLGGFATFNSGLKVNDPFGLITAIAPVCGGLPAKYAADYPDIPGWAFHGDQDTVVRYQQSENFVDAFNADVQRKNIFEYTLYPGVGHNCWDRAYSTSENHLTNWLNFKFLYAPRPVDNFKKVKDYVNSLV